MRRSDSTLEAFWTAASARWSAPLEVLVRRQGGPGFRKRLEAASLVAPARLAYRDDALASVSEWRRRGGRVALVSDGQTEATRAVAAHLDLFDEIHDISGPKAERDGHLDALYGPGRYAEFENVVPSRAALEPDLKAAASAPDKSLNRVPAALRLVRPHQWLKNFLIFVPMIAAHHLTLAAFAQALLAFIAFSLIASSTYVLNDLLDLNADRAHPRKRNRPLASGAVSLAQGTVMVPALAVAGVAIAMMSGLALLGMLALYFAATTAYSFKFKRLVVIDICMLAVLYTMRILAGSAATGIPSSVWLLAFSIFFFFSLAAVKRQAELVDGIASGLVTAHGRGYHVDDLAIVSNIVVASGMVSVMVLALYANSAPVLQLYSRPEMLWGVCLILLFWNSRIAILTHRGEMHDDPLVFAARDRTSQLCGLGILALGVAGTVL
ncbi:UbiA family prenyltransferase [Novosphingobium album (ex Hu et al. 2023)]|uniref:UbiA family prenyltransferase n=1 Tax=Novosphingobium album (ex Hu et al. 2023) TaxID=2930093 RepID=A0ABT0B6E8_9SPHN|nr:UbiA family prenyltransferase [Novosphingobium album (ex Hu et al. 2023)]MCJ2180625.1 UbiA family prenyltransferase [Novosphingobium album (ex Hu et al. 2023)]